MAIVYFYGTCMLDMISPYTGYHITKLLEKAGHRVIFPAEQTCCGQPAYNSGYRREAREVAKTQLDLFPEDYSILFPSGSCAAMMKHHYQELFVEGEFDYVSRKIEEWSSFYMNSNPEIIDRGIPTRIAWHGSCHSMREMQVEHQPLELLGQLSQVELIELPHQRECCGFGGTFAVKYGDISAAMGETKCQEILDAQVDALVSSDVGCMTHIHTRLEKLGGEIKFYHLADFIAERMGVVHPNFKSRQ